MWYETFQILNEQDLAKISKNNQFYRLAQKNKYIWGLLMWGLTYKNKNKLYSLSRLKIVAIKYNDMNYK